jgi:hypothetical protein
MTVETSTSFPATSASVHHDGCSPSAQNLSARGSTGNGARDPFSGIAAIERRPAARVEITDATFLERPGPVSPLQSEARHHEGSHAGGQPVTSRPARIAWNRVFAGGLLLRLLLFIPAMSSLSTGLAAFALVLNVVVAAGAFVGHRLAIAIGIYAALVGVAGLYFATTFDATALWIAIGLYSVALTVVGILAWRQPRRATG